MGATARLLWIDGDVIVVVGRRGEEPPIVGRLRF